MPTDLFFFAIQAPFGIIPTYLKPLFFARFIARILHSGTIPTTTSKQIEPRALSPCNNMRNDARPISRARKTCSACRAKCTRHERPSRFVSQNIPHGSPRQNSKNGCTCGADISRANAVASATVPSQKTTSATASDSMRDHAWRQKSHEAPRPGRISSEPLFNCEVCNIRREPGQAGLADGDLPARIHGLGP